jgi:hypothetical protein
MSLLDDISLVLGSLKRNLNQLAWPSPAQPKLNQQG